MIKHFCDECSEELTSQEVAFCDEMFGTKELCTKHIRLWLWTDKRLTKYVKSIPNLYKDTFNVNENKIKNFIKKLDKKSKKQKPVDGNLFIGSGTSRPAPPKPGEA